MHGGRLREQQAEGVRMPQGIALPELALRILIAADVLPPLKAAVSTLAARLRELEHLLYGSIGSVDEVEVALAPEVRHGPATDNCHRSD